VVKRVQRPSPPRPAGKEESRPTWPPERHSGEGSASALETLQKLEKNRAARKPAEPAED
jgi:hypothetical protein